MKAALLTLLMLAYATGIFAQPYAFQDASKLKKILGTQRRFDTAAFRKALPILQKYLDEGESIEVITGNPFFSEMIDKSARDAIAGGKFVNRAERAGNDRGDEVKLSAIGGLDVTTVADGLARFLVKRTKEELNVMFFDRFRKEMSKEKYKDAFTLFPETCQLLFELGDRIHMYQAFLPALQESFQKDLNSLTDHLPNVIEAGRYSNFFDNHPALKYTSLSGVRITAGILDNKHPGEIIETFPTEYWTALVKEKDKIAFDSIALINLVGSMQTMQLISTSLKADERTQYWEDPSKLLSEFKEPIVVRMYFGLLYKQARGINFSKDNLQGYLAKAEADFTNKLQPYASFCVDLAQRGQSLQRIITEAENNDDKKPVFDDYYKYFNGVVDLFEFAGKVTTLPGIKELDTEVFDVSLQKYVRVGRLTAMMALDVKQRNYSSAIINGYSIYNFAFSKDVIARDWPKRNNQSEDLQKTAEFSSVLLRFGSFMSAVASAKNSEEVSNAIEAAALPVGSSRIKRESKGNISLNAYVGPFVAHEHIQGVDTGARPNSYGVIAPVGIAASLGKAGWVNGNKNSSWTLFISIIDLGAVTAFRFGDANAEKVPTIQLRDVVSPGAFISYGFGKIPLSAAFGAQVGPRLRNVDASVNNIASKMYTRYSLSLTVDIPLLNFATWPAKEY